MVHLDLGLIWSRATVIYIEECELFHLPPGSSASSLAHTCGFMGGLLSEDTNWIYCCKLNWASTFPHPNSGMALKSMVRNSPSVSSYEQHVGRCALILYTDTWTVTNGRATWSGSCKEHGWEAVKKQEFYWRGTGVGDECGHRTCLS